MALRFDTSDNRKILTCMMDGGGCERELLADGVQCHTKRGTVRGHPGLGAAAGAEWRPHVFGLSWYRTGTLYMDEKGETGEISSQSALLGSFKACELKSTCKFEAESLTSNDRKWKFGSRRCCPILMLHKVLLRALQAGRRNDNKVKIPLWLNAMEDLSCSILKCIQCL